MSFYTDWFIADDSEAEAIASTVTTEDRSRDDWPNLSIKNIGEIDLATLWGILRGEPDSPKLVMGGLLFQDGEDVFVCRIEPGFVEALAVLEQSDLNPIVESWNKSETLSEWKPDELRHVVQNLICFACRAKEAKKPVLLLSVL